MPKFMTYQRPAPVNKASWNGRSGGNPYLPIRKPAASLSRPDHQQVRPVPSKHQ